MIIRLENTSQRRSIRLRMAFACASAIGLLTPANCLHGNSSLRQGHIGREKLSVHACVCECPNGAMKSQNSSTSTTQSRSIATPNATPDSLSTAPASTSTMNQGRRRRDDTEGGTECA